MIGSIDGNLQFYSKAHKCVSRGYLNSASPKCLRRVDVKGTVVVTSAKSSCLGKRNLYLKPIRSAENYLQAYIKIN